MPTELLVSTSPVFTVAGVEQGALARDLTFLRVDEATDGMKTLELHLTGFGPTPNVNEERELWLDGAVLDFGAELGVSIGGGDGAYVVFVGRVSALESVVRIGESPSVVVYAEDGLMTLRQTRRMRTYADMSDADIAREIGGEHGLQVAADADGPTYRVVQQWNQSDLAFLRERARLLQAELWLDGDTLHFATRGNRSSTELTLIAGSDLLDVRCRADLAHQRTSVTVSGYDATRRERVDESAEHDAVDAEVTGGRTGPAVLERAFGARASFRVRENPLGAEEARAWATAEMLRRARGFVTVTGLTHGSADMVVGSRIALERVGTPFLGGGYYVTRVSHTYDLEQGFRTYFEAERATLNEGAA